MISLILIIKLSFRINYFLKINSFFEYKSNIPNIKKLVIAILLLKKFPADEIGQKIIIALIKKPLFSD